MNVTSFECFCFAIKIYSYLRYNSEYTTIFGSNRNPFFKITKSSFNILVKFPKNRIQSDSKIVRRNAFLETETRWKVAVGFGSGRFEVGVKVRKGLDEEGSVRRTTDEPSSSVHNEVLANSVVARACKRLRRCSRAYATHNRACDPKIHALRLEHESDFEISNPPPPSSCPSSLKKLLSSFSLRFKFQDFRLWSCCIQATLVSKNFDRIWDIFATCSIYYETLVGFCKSLQKFFDSFLCLLLSPKFLSSFDFYQFYWIDLLNSIQNFVSFFWKSLLSWKIL